MNPVEDEIVARSSFRRAGEACSVVGRDGRSYDFERAERE